MAETPEVGAPDFLIRSTKIVGIWALKALWNWEPGSIQSRAFLVGTIESARTCSWKMCVAEIAKAFQNVWFLGRVLDIFLGAWVGQELGKPRPACSRWHGTGLHCQRHALLEPLTTQLPRQFNVLVQTIQCFGVSFSLFSKNPFELLVHFLECWKLTCLWLRVKISTQRWSFHWMRSIEETHIVYIYISFCRYVEIWV